MKTVSLVSPRNHRSEFRRRSQRYATVLIYPEGWGSEEVPATWDDDVQKLEAHMTDIAVQVIVTAEIKYRENALHQYQSRLKRKAELEEIVSSWHMIAGTAQCLGRMSDRSHSSAWNVAISTLFS